MATNRAHADSDLDKCKPVLDMRLFGSSLPLSHGGDTKTLFSTFRYNQFALQFTGAMAKTLYALREISISKCLSNFVVSGSLAQRAFAGCACLLPKYLNSGCTKNAASAESIASLADDLKSASVTLLIFFFTAFLWLQSQQHAAQL